jgi:hypothetical protein
MIPQRPPLSTCPAGGLIAAFMGIMVLLTGCSETPQTVGSKPRADAKAWQGSAQASPYAASGWKAGDETSWQAQIRTRGQQQNEYLRAPAAAK